MEKSCDAPDVIRDVEMSRVGNIRERLGGMVWSRGRASWYLNEHGHNTSTYPACALNFRRSLITTDLDEFTVYGRNAWWGVYRAWHFVSYWPWVYSLALLCFIGDDSKEFRPSDTRLSKRDACRSHQMCDRTCHNTRLNSDYGSAVSIVGHMPDCESNPVRPELHILFQVSQLFGIGSDSQYLHQVSRLAHRPPRLFKQTFQSGNVKHLARLARIAGSIRLIEDYTKMWRQDIQDAKTALGERILL